MTAHTPEPRPRVIPLSGRRATLARALIVGVAALAASPQAAAPARSATAAASQATEPTKLTVGEQTATPGAPVVVPLTFSAPDTTNAGAIEIRLTYPKALLTFAKLEPSGLALGVFAKIETAVDKGPDAASSTLVATISTPAGAEARKAFGSGLLAYVGFTIAKTAKPGTTIPLKMETVVRTAEAEPKPVPKVTSVNGKIVVAQVPVVSCFFYMH